MFTLITGATGFIGRHLTPRLLEAGDPVRVLTRDPKNLPHEWANKVEVATGSLLDPEILREATDGVSTIFHLAAEIRDPALMKAVNATAVRGLLESAVAAGVKRFVHLSSVGVVGADQSGVITEESVCDPKSEYERTKLEGEQEVLKFAQAGLIDALIVRPTNVFGEGRAPSHDSILGWLQAIRKGRFVFIGKEGIANYVYVGDVVAAMIRLVESTSSKDAIYNIADPSPMRAFVEAMSEALGAPVPTKSVPPWAAYAIGAALEFANRLLGTPAPLTRSRVRALSTKVLFSGNKLQLEGITHPFGFRDGLCRTVQWYREVGRL